MNAKPVPGSKVTDQSALGRRDAFHVPAVVVKSDRVVSQGYPVKFTGPSQVIPVVAKEEGNGFVDPWIEGYINPGELFWVFVDPKLVGDLTHHFTVAGVPEPPIELSQLPVNSLTIQGLQEVLAARIEEMENKLKGRDEEPESSGDSYCDYSRC